MDPNSWTRLSTSKRYQSRSDAFHFVEESDGDEQRAEYLCPFCAEDFDIVGLCCHIDEEHPVQAKNGDALHQYDNKDQQYQNPLHKMGTDAFHFVEESDGDEQRAEYLCPFCAEDFDIVGLCCHIDEEHPVQAKNGVCPICAKRVGTGLVSHITMQHGSLLKIQRKRRLRRGGSNSTFSYLKKELRDGNLQSLLGGSSFLIPSSTNTEPDPLLFSFMYNDVVDTSQDQTDSPTATLLTVEGSSKDLLARSEKQQGATLSGEDQEEKARQSEFVQGLLMSTFLNDDL